MAERATWRCSNCGSPAELKGGYAPMDPRYGVGKCGSCTLRSDVPLIMASSAEAQAMIAEREAREQAKKQLPLLRVGAIPRHPRTPGCCEVKASVHLSAEQLDRLLPLLG